MKLTKEEVPILHDNIFQIPIHPELLKVTLPPKLATRIFPETTEEWFEGLKEYRRTADLDKSTEEWYDRVWLKEKPRVEREGTHQVIKPGNWRDDYFNEENGFARCLSIDRNSGGSLYFSKTALECQRLLSPKGGLNEYIRFSPEKTKEFGFKEENYGDETLIRVYIYEQRNADRYPEALFLRDWAIKYMNEAFKYIAG